MSLSARIAVEPSRAVARAQLVVPLIGLLVATTTLWDRWPAHRAGMMLASAVGAAVFATIGLRRVRDAREACRLTLSSRDELDVVSAGAAIDGTCRLVDSTVVWSGFWILALQPDGRGRIRRLAFEPRALDPDARRSLARFLTWSVRARGGRNGDPEKSAG